MGKCFFLTNFKAENIFVNTPFLFWLLLCSGFVLCASCQNAKNINTNETGNKVEIQSIGYCDLLKSHRNESGKIVLDYEGKAVRVRAIMKKYVFNVGFEAGNCELPYSPIMVEFAPDIDCTGNDSTNKEICEIVELSKQKSDKVSKRLKVDIVGKLEKRSEGEMAKDAISDLPSWRFRVEKLNDSAL